MINLEHLTENAFVAQRRALLGHRWTDVLAHIDHRRTWATLRSALAGTPPFDWSTVA